LRKLDTKLYAGNVIQKRLKKRIRKGETLKLINNNYERRNDE